MLIDTEHQPRLHAGPALAHRAAAWAGQPFPGLPGLTMAEILEKPAARHVRARPGEQMFDPVIRAGLSPGTLSTFCTISFNPSSPAR